MGAPQSPQRTSSLAIDSLGLLLRQGLLSVHSDLQVVEFDLPRVINVLKVLVASEQTECVSVGFEGNANFGHGILHFRILVTNDATKEEPSDVRRDGVGWNDVCCGFIEGTLAEMATEIGKHFPKAFSTGGSHGFGLGAEWFCTKSSDPAAGPASITAVARQRAGGLY